jgi:hypothetical protein
VITRKGQGAKSGCGRERLPRGHLCSAASAPGWAGDGPAAWPSRHFAFRGKYAVAGSRRKYGLDIQQDAAEIKLRAERRLGELLAEKVGHSGGSPSHRERNLPDGVTHNQSHRWQKVASVEAPDFERYVTGASQVVSRFGAEGQPDRRFVRLIVGTGPVPLKEPRMKMFIVLAAAVLLVGLAHGVLAEPPGKELAVLEKKMVGAWKGRGCDGNFLFRADGTYELTQYGPAPYDTAGTWKVRWDALPPTLVLTCKKSEDPDEVGKTLEVKLIKLDAKSLAIKYAIQNGSPPGQYTRVTK